MEEVISGIYKIQNSNTGKIYIGSSKDIYKRFSQHKRNLELNRHHSCKLQNSYNKTKDKSIFVYEIIEKVIDIDQLKIREQYWIDYYDSFKNGYNCSNVDDPRFTNKTISKNKKKSKLENLYAEFFKLYSNSYCIIGNVMLDRLNNRYYSVRTLNQLLFGLHWFLNNYDKEKYSIQFKYDKFMKNYPLITVRDKNRNDIDYYYIRNNELTKEYL